MLQDIFVWDKSNSVHLAELSDASPLTPSALSPSVSLALPCSQVNWQWTWHPIWTSNEWAFLPRQLDDWCCPWCNKGKSATDINASFGAQFLADGQEVLSSGTVWLLGFPNIWPLHENPRGVCECNLWQKESWCGFEAIGCDWVWAQQHSGVCEIAKLGLLNAQGHPQGGPPSQQPFPSLGTPIAGGCTVMDFGFWGFKNGQNGPNGSDLGCPWQILVKKSTFLSLGSAFFFCWALNFFGWAFQKNKHCNPNLFTKTVKKWLIFSICQKNNLSPLIFKGEKHVFLENSTETVKVKKENGLQIHMFLICHCGQL